MSTAITKISGKAMELSEVEAMIQAEMAEEVNAFDLKPAQIKIAPGGIGQYVMGDDAAKKFQAVVAISQKKYLYWPSKEGTGEAPLCVSNDGMTGTFNTNASDQQKADAVSAPTVHPYFKFLESGKTPPASFGCGTCPLNKWGSGPDGKGSACQEKRALLVLPDGWAMPALMSLPRKSLKPWDTYCSTLASQRKSYFAVRTLFELENTKNAEGQPYSFVKLTALEVLPAEVVSEVIAVRHQYRELISNIVLVDDEDNGVSAEYRVTENDTSDTPF